MLASLITSKTRIKLLLKFFLNGKTRAYLRGLEEEFGESSNAIRLELNRFEEAGLLITDVLGNKKMYQANESHPLFVDLHNIVLKHIGVDRIVEEVVTRSGNPDSAWLIGDFAKGRDGLIIDLLLVGSDIDQAYVSEVCDKVQSLISKRIRYMVIASSEEKQFLSKVPHALLIWKKD